MENVLTEEVLQEMYFGKRPGLLKIEDYFDKIKVELTDNVSDGQLKIDAILDIFMVSKYFERISDHSVNIAQWVLYMITGNLEGNTN